MKWEYTYALNRSLQDLRDDFDSYGHDEWELVTILKDEDGEYCAVFKRPKQ